MPPALSAALVGTALVGMALCRSLQRIATKDALELGVPPFALTFVPLLVAAALMVASSAAWILWQKRRGHSMRLPWRYGATLGILNIAMPGIGFTLGQQGLSATAAALFVTTIPVAVTAMAALLLGERVGKLGIGGMLLAFCGVGYMILGRSGGGAAEVSTLQGVFFSGAAVLAAAYAYVVIRRRGKGDDLWSLLALQIAISAIAVGLSMWALEGIPEWAVIAPAGALLGGLALSNYVLPQLFLLAVLRYATATSASFANYLTPLITALILWYWRGSSVTDTVMISAAMIMLGAVAVQRGSRRKRA